MGQGKLSPARAVRRTAASIIGVLIVLTSTCGGAAAADKARVGANLVPAGWPQRLVIPRIAVNTPLETVSLTKKSDVHAPYQWNDAAWYDMGPRPGDPGNAVVFGHLDSTCCPAVFWNLSALHPGDIIRVAYNGGRTLSFKVLWQKTFASTKFPTKWLFGSARDRALVLFTCAGTFHRDGTGYDHKLFVYARMILPGGRLG